MHISLFKIDKHQCLNLLLGEGEGTLCNLMSICKGTLTLIFDI